MALPPGTRLGVYEVTAQIGEGGMGQVYRATDTKLKRQVAIKILPPSLAADHDRLARFQREAEVLASLNHPHIAGIYGLEESDGVSALVMELVEGEDLSQRIARGAMPLEEALPIAKQIAEALEAAHEQGIVHRDLKPANIKIRPDSTVKVLDFGLAKALTGPAGSAGSLENSPTITSPAMMTAVGMILGTAAYMSPEQARGKPVDKRADIWALGCVLFEMVAGRRPFGGDDVTEVVANVIAKEPAWSALPSGTPAELRRLLTRCLTKDRRNRLHDIADVRLELQDALAGAVTPEASASAARTMRGPGSLHGFVAALALLVGLGAGAVLWRRPPTPALITHLTVEAAPADEITTTSVLGMLPAGGRLALAWSPTGQTLAFVGSRQETRQIYLRDLASGEARALAGTESAQAVTYSPDGEWIAFWAGGELKRLRVAGGPPERICTVAQVTGLTWGSMRIVYTTRHQIFEVAPTGGVPRALTESDMRRSTPLLLPDGNALLYTEYGKLFTSGDERVMIRRLDTESIPSVLLPEAADARYLATGHLAFMRQGTLFAVPFDPATLQMRGSPVAVLSGVAQSSAAWFSDDLTLSGQFAFSPQGTLAYVPGREVSLPVSDLVRVNRRGDVTNVGAPPNTYRERVEVSPDGSELAVSVQSKTDIRLFLYDMTRGTLTPITPANREAIRPIWSIDGKIAMQVFRMGGSHPAVLAADRVTLAEEPLMPQNGFAPSGWLRRGEALIGHRAGDLWTLAASASREKWVRLSENAATEQHPSWSPDGKWVVYSSDISGREEVYVQSYPSAGAPVVVSTEGGRAPVWTRDGREVIYAQRLTADPTTNVGFRVMAVSMTNPARPGRPVSLFDVRNDTVPMGVCASTPCYSVAPDGQSFYTMRFRSWQPPRVTSVRLIQNWFEEVRRLAPAN